MERCQVWPAAAMGVRSQPRPYVHSNFEWTVRTSETSCPGVFGRRGPPGVGELSIHRPPLSVAECSRAVETLLFVPLCRAHFACSACMHAIYALLCAAACPVALSPPSARRARSVTVNLAESPLGWLKARGQFCCSCNSGSRPCFAVGVLWLCLCSWSSRRSRSGLMERYQARPRRCGLGLAIDQPLGSVCSHGTFPARLRSTAHGCLLCSRVETVVVGTVAASVTLLAAALLGCCFSTCGDMIAVLTVPRGPRATLRSLSLKSVALRCG